MILVDVVPPDFSGRKIETLGSALLGASDVLLTR
jgi:hypothetical protein